LTIEILGAIVGHQIKEDDMSNNAMWWVRATDKKTGQTLFLILSSPDLSNPVKAHKRARDAAKARWVKQGYQPVGASSQCVG
jgi:hypothetical protein